MEDETEMLLWAILLCIQREYFDRIIANRKGETLHEYQMKYMIALVLQGNYEEEVLEKTFGLSTTLQAMIKVTNLH